MLENSERKFGVEIEFVGIGQYAAAQAISAAGVPCTDEAYNHHTRSYWKIVDDGSVRGAVGTGELVSPPLSGAEGLAQVRKVLRALVAAGGRVNSTCGLHVHVDCNDLSVPDLANVVNRYATFENTINSFMPASRRNGQWARSVQRAGLARTVSGYQSVSALKAACGYWERYYAVNVASFARYGTLEFRQHSGTVNGSKVAHWIAFCVGFVEASRVANMPATIPVVAPPPRAPATPLRNGRRPNFRARQILVDNLLLGGCSVTLLAARCGYRVGTLEGSIFPQLRSMGSLTMNGDGHFRFAPNNQAVLDVWLGNTPYAAPAAPTPPVVVPDTLFRDLDWEVEAFFMERAMELAPR